MKREIAVQTFVTSLIIANVITAVFCSPRVVQNNTDVASTSMNTANQKDNDTSVTIELKEVPPGKGSPQFAGLSATVKLDRTQSYQQGGIKMLISLTNKGKTSIGIKNPLEHMDIFLLDKEGRGIKLPPTLSRYLLDEYKGGEKPAPDIQLPFHLFLMTLNGRQLDSKEINGYKFDLAVRGTLQIGVEIDKIVKKSSSADSEQPEITRIPPGDYQIKAALYLHDLENSTIQKNLVSEFIKVQLVDKETAKSK